MKKFAGFDLTPFVVVILACVIAMGYLLITGGLNRELFFILAGISTIMFMASLQDKRDIDFFEARDIAFKTITKLQLSREIPAGTLRLMPETGLRYIVYHNPNPTIEPKDWNIGVVVDGKQQLGFLVKVSRYGGLMEVTSIDIPSDWKVSEIEDYTYVKGSKDASVSKIQEVADKNVDKGVDEDDHD